MNPGPVILALDLATNLGWCVGAVDRKPDFGTHKLPSTGEDIGRFALAYDHWLRTVLVKHQPALVIFESPILPRVTQLMTMRKLTGLAYHTEMVCSHQKVRCEEAMQQSVRKFFTGRGNAKKADTIACAQRYGFDVQDDNAADAIAVFAWALQCHWPQQAARFAMGPIGAGRAA